MDRIVKEPFEGPEAAHRGNQGTLVELAAMLHTKTRLSH
jgi:hypothetical protein